MRILLVLMISVMGLSAAKADTLAEIAQFTQMICGDIPEGNMTKTAIQGKVAANAGLVAKIVSGDANLSASRIEEIYKGIPLDRLPSSIPTVAMCKSELAKVMLAKRSQAPPPVVAQYSVCVGEYARACQTHDTYLYCGADVQGWANGKCASATVTHLNSYGGNKCGYAMFRVFCTNPKG